MRALDILEYFGVQRQPLRAKQIVHRFNLHHSSADQLLKTMVEAGYLVFDPATKLYDLSFRLAKFAGWLATDFRTTELDRILDELGASTEAIVFLAQRSDDFMRVVESRVGADESVGQALGCLLPLDTMTGQAFLSSCSEQDTRWIVDHAVLHRRLPREASSTLLERVRWVRLAGHAVGARSSRHLWSVSVPLTLNPSQRTRTLVLSVTGGRERMLARQDRIIRLVQDGANAILGKPPAVGGVARSSSGSPPLRGPSCI